MTRPRRLPRRAWAAALAAGALLALAPPAHGAWRLLARPQHPVVTDGTRYAAWQPKNSGVTRVMDTRNGATRTLRTPTVVRVMPPTTPAQLPCRVSGIAAARVTWDCRYSDGPVAAKASWGARLYDLRRRRFLTVRGLGRLRTRYPDAEFFTFGPAGETWIFGSAVSGGSGRAFRLAWRTGRLARWPRLRDDQVVDLDRPSGVRNLCRPLRRRDADATYYYAPPFGLAFLPSPRNPLDLRLRIDRCGHPSRTIGPCRCWGAALGGGVVSWVQRPHVVVLDPATGRRAPIPVGRTQGDEGAGSHVKLTATRVFLMVHGPSVNEPDWRMYVAPLRRP